MFVYHASGCAIFCLFVFVFVKMCCFLCSIVFSEQSQKACICFFGTAIKYFYISFYHNTIITAKSGNPSEYELEELAHDLGDKWEDLGRHLGFTQAALSAFHKENERLVDKPLRMLIDWKRREGSDATYQALSDALCNKFVGLKELAEKFCS